MHWIKIASKDEIYRAREPWNRLVQSMKLPTVFLTWEWVITWLKTLGKRCTPLILVITDESKILAIVPLAKKRMKLGCGFLTVRAIIPCGTLGVTPDHLDIICSSTEDANGYLEKTFQFLQHSYTQWDVLHLPYLAADGHLCSWLRSYSGPLKHRIVDTIDSPFMSLRGGATGAISHLSKKARYNLNRETKILFATNQVTFAKVQSEAELTRALEELFELHNKRITMKGSITTFGRHPFRDFHIGIARSFFENGWLRLYVLRSAETPIAAVYGFAFGGRFFYFQTGFDPEWSKYSPGKLLIYRVLEDLSREGISEFDFLGGTIFYKTFWATGSRHMESFDCYNRNLRATTEYYTSRVRDILKLFILSSFPSSLVHRLKMRRAAKYASDLGKALA
jgi:CelD/BcsL family acetyltransferase involved in cellulose biosynthesis